MAFKQDMQGAQNIQGQQAKEGAQSQQGGMSGQGAQVTEESLLNLVLNETKLMAGSINTYILEASDDALGRDYMTVLGDIYSQQKQLFDCMEQKGYYQLTDATAEEVAETRAKFQKAGN